MKRNFSSSPEFSVNLPAHWINVEECDDEVFAAVVPDPTFATNLGIKVIHTPANDSGSFLLSNYISLNQAKGFREIYNQQLTTSLGFVAWLAYSLPFEDNLSVATVQYFPVVIRQPILITFALLEVQLDKRLPEFHEIVRSLEVV